MTADGDVRHSDVCGPFHDPWITLLHATALRLVWRSPLSRIAPRSRGPVGRLYRVGDHVSEDRTDANIRIALLVIYPVLVVLTVLAVWSDCRAPCRR